MANRKQISCIVKNESSSEYDRIVEVGGISGNIRWKEKVSTVISNIELGFCTYFTKVNNHEMEVVVSTRNGIKYIKTEPDQDTPDNLLSLNTCN